MLLVQADLDPATPLQIAELVGTVEEKRSARADMYRLVSSSSGSQVGRAFYEGSVLRSALWNILLANASSEESARKIVKMRPRISAKFEGDSIKLDLSAIEESDYAISQAAIVKQLESELEPIADTVKEAKKDLVGPSVAKALHTLRRASRQEERIAILLDTLLRDREAGEHLLSVYSGDRAKYANAVVRQLRKTLSSPNKAPEQHDAALVEIALRAFSRGMPLNRVQLLYYLSRYLGTRPTVKQLLVRRYLRMSTSFLRPFEADIRDSLGLPRLPEDQQRNAIPKH
jgi:hypothetical protein